MPPPPPKNAQQTNTQVPCELFQWQLAAFGGVMVLNILNILFCTSQVQHNCNVLLIAIHGVAFATDLALVRRATPVARGGAAALGAGALGGGWSWPFSGSSGGGSSGSGAAAAAAAASAAAVVAGPAAPGAGLFFPLRYIQWLHSTPTMLLLMALMSDLTAAQLWATLACDVIMIVTGLAASWLGGGAQVAAAVASFLAFVPVVAAMAAMFRRAVAEARGARARALLRLMLLTTLGVWSLFPAVWAAAHLGLLSPAAEHALWGIADFAAKVVFSSHLWQKNFVTLEQRQADAQRALDEASRALLIERLRGLLASKERLVHGLTHELRTPINGIIALSNELLHSGGRPGAGAGAGRAKMTAMIRSSAGCLLNIINAMLDAAAASSGTLRLASYKVNLWRVAESVARLTRPLVKDDVALLNLVPRDAPPVKADSARLMQVLFNLVGNASRFTQSGSIRITAAPSAASPDALVVSVADTGAGIAPERLPTIFEPFEAGPHAPGGGGPRAGGTGLGLYLVKQCLDAMGCEIKVDSSVGGGTTFSFELPLADDDAESEEEPPSDADPLGAAAAVTPSGRSSMESPAAGAAGAGGADGKPRRSSLELGARVAQSLMRRLSANGSSSTAAAAAAKGDGDASASPTVAGALPTTADAATPREGGGGGGGADSGSAAAAEAAAAGLAAGTSAALPSPPPGAAAGAAAAAAAEDADDRALLAAAAAAPDAAPPAPPKPSHRARYGTIQVLSVDDDAINQMVAATALKSHKWSVVKCMNGMEVRSRAGWV